MITTPAMRKIFTLTPLAATLLPGIAAAGSYFNPAFLSEDVALVADLSRFETGSQQPPGAYRVDIWRNAEFIATEDMHFNAATPDDDAVEAAKSGSLTPCLDVNWLKRLGVNMQAYPALTQFKPGECIPLSEAIPGAETHYDFARLQLKISLPQASLHNSARGYIPPEQWDEGIPAALLNYTFSGNRGTYDDSYYLNVQSGLNYGPWRLRNNSAWRYTTGTGFQDNRWENIGTSLQRILVPLKSELVMGDSNSGSDVFDSLGFRGARLYSVDSMYPDSLQGYAPTVRGIARTNAKLVIRQNGYVIYQSYVSPGPFAITDLNPTSSSGNLEVTVEENDGSQQQYSVPYSTVPLLQREGRLKYDLVMGDFRSGNKQQASLFFTQGALIAGLPNGYTVYGGAQLAGRYRAAALGTGKNLNAWGAISMDITHAQSKLANDSEHQGQSLRFLYAKSLNDYGTNFQLLGYRYSTRGFYNLNDVAYRNMEGYEYGPREGEGKVATRYHNLRYNKKGRFQANISQSLGGYGSLYASGSQQSYWGTDQTNAWYQLGYASGWRGISYSLSWSWSQSLGLADNNRLVAFNLSVPFSALSGKGYSRDSVLDRAYTTTSVNHSSEGKTRWQSGVGGTLLDDRSVNYRVTQGHSSDNGYTGSANASWQGSYGNLGLGYNYDRDQRDFNWQTSGGVVGHAEGVTLSQPLGSTNVLIAAPGASGVRVENQIGMKTDWRGYAVIPNASVYRYNRVGLDINSMDNHTEIENNVSSVVPTEGALVKASFDARIGVRAIITLQRGDLPVPFGSSVREENSGVTSMAGDEGQVYLSGLPLTGRLRVQWGEGDSAQCVADYQLPADSLKQTVVMATARCI